MLKLIKGEPALFTGLIGALIALGVAFGLKFTPEQVGAVMAIVSAGLAFVTRSQVTPVVPAAVPETTSPEIP